MDEPKPEGNGGQNNDELRIQSTTSLGVLLIVFLGIFLIALFIIMTGKTLPEGAGREAYSPADFPEIFGKEPVEGLASLTSLVLVASTTQKDKESQNHVAPPPFSDGIFPCSNCHAGMETNETVRAVGDPHAEILLNHGNPQERWCLDCHSSKNRDVLRLAGGKEIPFTESFRLCGQCHGNIFRDWKIGIHGKRVGYWNGPKIYLLCVHCHNPHSPKFKPLKPLPPPIRPDFQNTIPVESPLKNASGSKGGVK